MTTTWNNSLPGMTVRLNGVEVTPEAAQLIVDGLQQAVYAAKGARHKYLNQHCPAFMTQVETLLRQTPGVSNVYGSTIATLDFRYAERGYRLRGYPESNEIELRAPYVLNRWPMADYVLPPTPDDDSRAQALVAAIMTALDAESEA